MCAPNTTYVGVIFSTHSRPNRWKPARQAGLPPFPIATNELEAGDGGGAQRDDLAVVAVVAVVAALRSLCAAVALAAAVRRGRPSCMHDLNSVSVDSGFSLPGIDADHESNRIERSEEVQNSKNPQLR